LIWLGSGGLWAGPGLGWFASQAWVRGLTRHGNRLRRRPSPTLTPRPRPSRSRPPQRKLLLIRPDDGNSGEGPPDLLPHGRRGQNIHLSLASSSDQRILYIYVYYVVLLIWHAHTTTNLSTQIAGCRQTGNRRIFPRYRVTPPAWTQHVSRILATMTPNPTCRPQKPANFLPARSAAKGPLLSARFVPSRGDEIHGARRRKHAPFARRKCD